MVAMHPFNVMAWGPFTCISLIDCLDAEECSRLTRSFQLVASTLRTLFFFRTLLWWQKGFGMLSELIPIKHSVDRCCFDGYMRMLLISQKNIEASSPSSLPDVSAVNVASNVFRCKYKNLMRCQGDEWSAAYLLSQRVHAPGDSGVTFTIVGGVH